MQHLRDVERCRGCYTQQDTAIAAARPRAGMLVVLTWSCRQTIGRGAHRRVCRCPTALVITHEGARYHYGLTIEGAPSWPQLRTEVVETYGPAAAWELR